MVAIAPKEPGWKDFKDAVRFLDEEGGTVEAKEGDGAQEMNREEEVRSDTRRSRTSAGSTRLRFVLKST